MTPEFHDKGKPSVMVGRKAMGPSSIEGSPGCRMEVVFPESLCRSSAKGRRSMPSGFSQDFLTTPLASTRDRPHPKVGRLFQDQKGTRSMFSHLHQSVVNF